MKYIHTILGISLIVIASALFGSVQSFSTPDIHIRLTDRVKISSDKIGLMNKTTELDKIQAELRLLKTDMLMIIEKAECQADFKNLKQSLLNFQVDDFMKTLKTLKEVLKHLPKNASNLIMTNIPEAFRKMMIIL